MDIDNNNNLTLDAFNKVNIKEYITNPQYSLKENIHFDQLRINGLSQFAIKTLVPFESIFKAYYYYLLYQANVVLDVGEVMQQEINKFYDEIDSFGGFEQLENALSLFSNNIEYKVDEPTLYTIIRALVTRLFVITTNNIKLERCIHILTAISYSMFKLKYQDKTTTPSFLLKFMLDIVVNSLIIKFILNKDEFKMNEDYFNNSLINDLGD